MIILSSGSINFGKTTTAKHLIRTLPRTAHVEVDDLREFIQFMPLEESIPLNLANAIAVTRNFAAALTDRGTRALTEWELKRVPYHYETGINSPPFGVVIDNTRQMPEETTRQILEHVKE